jgi:site-specific recombinase XerD
MSMLREQMIRDMTIKGLSQKTMQSYVRYIVEYAKYYNKSPDKMGPNEIKEYLSYLITQRKLSNEYVRGCYCAMRFLYGTTLARHWESFKIPQLKRKRKTPEIPTDEEVQKIIDNAPQAKYRTLFKLMFATGMRISEAIALKINDIQPERGLIQIWNGKGQKDRVTLLPPTLLEELEEHLKEYKPTRWVFAGDKPGAHITARSVQRAFKNSLLKSCITKQFSVHSLRHKFATSVVEMGNDIYRLQQLMGHSYVRTTSRYIHISNLNALKVESPLERLMRDRNKNL